MTDWRGSIANCVRAVSNREISVREIAESTLHEIATKDRALKAFTYVEPDAVLEQASELDTRLARGEHLGSLAGVPVGVKDLFDVEGLPTSYGGGPFAPRLPDRDAAAVARLRGAGALLVGKTRTSEFAWRSTTPPTQNPRDHTLVTGGSSGGSAAAVGAGIVRAALGTDTGGSIRVPAALCGVVGIKPTYGLVSRVGILPGNLSLDTAGPITATVADARALLAVLVEHDQRDPASVSKDLVERVRKALEASRSQVDLKGLRLAVIESPLFEIVDTRAREHHGRILDLVAEAGAHLIRVDLPEAMFVQATLLAVDLPEGAAFHTERLRTRAAEFNDEVRALLHVGHLIPGALLSRGYQARRRIKASIAELFRKHQLSAILTPATGAPPGPSDNPGFVYQRVSGETELATWACARPSWLANVTGQPALVLPTIAGSPPLGLQLIGRPFRDEQILDIGEAIEELLTK